MPAAINATSANSKGTRARMRTRLLRGPVARRTINGCFGLFFVI
jgi:threonine/homoserine/homoserine lactone efflux protein